MAYGGAGFARPLIRGGLVDEYRLNVQPAAFGAGLPIFTELPGRCSSSSSRRGPSPAATSARSTCRDSRRSKRRGPNPRTYTPPVPPRFEPLPSSLDHPRLEERILELWETRDTFERLREQNRGNRKFSFIDGPVTANKSMGVHTAWGRTLKDVFQRYKALRGFDQRYQNGYDCQGLWIEVGVEKSLGLNSKAEIEEYGLERFAEKCREVVEWSSTELTRASKRLGQWMDWGNDYFTFSDTNIEYIWRFLKIVDERGWLFRGHRASEWCPRCGTSLSQHELTQAGVYQDIEHPSLFIRFPLVDRPGESLVVWTTTPWTLPANVAAAVNPEVEYGRRASGEWVAVSSAPDDDYVERLPGTALVGWGYKGPFDDLAPGSEVAHRVIPWSGVELDQGTGIVHIAPGAGREDFELAGELDLPVLTPVDEAGRYYPNYGPLAGKATHEVADWVVDNLREKGLVERAETITHAYPHCWRCDTPLIFRVSDDWFISVDGVRERMLEENRTIEWTPPQYGKRMDDWLRNMGDWNISRRRYYGLPLPIYPCECGRVNVVGSREELEGRALEGIEGLAELHRPWIDRVLISCEECDAPVRRVTEVGDVWLDAGIVPFSTLGWENPDRVEGGYATGASRGLSTADLPDHAYWEEWFPAEWVTEMREQIRLWFYSMLFMSVVLTDRSPYRKVLTYEKLLDADGREMHGSWGNLISAEDAFESMGADVMRWLYCQQPPTQNIRFGHAPADEIRRRLLTVWNSARFLVDYAAIEDFEPRYDDLLDGLAGTELRPLDLWLLARVQQLVSQAEGAYDAYLTVEVVQAVETFVEDLSNWYIRRSRRRFYSYDEAAFRTLWTALTQLTRVVAPIMPFLAEELWQKLVVDAGVQAPDSVFLAGWPEVQEPFVDEPFLAEIAETRRVVQLGRRARAEAGVKGRQPLRTVYVRGAPLAAAHAAEIGEELRVKEVAFDAGPEAPVSWLPNLRVLGPRLGAKIPEVKAALERGEVEQRPDGSLLVAGEILGPDDVIRGERHAIEGWAIAGDGTVSIAFDTTLDDELRAEGRVYELIHTLNANRKEQGLELSDRVTVALPRRDADLLAHADWIRAEVLATEIVVDESVNEPVVSAGSPGSPH
jgi:isoleucyl-tRNA synthetase